MFMLQLICALIIFIWEMVSRTEIHQSLVYYYYRYGTSIRGMNDQRITIENSRSLVYQIKMHWLQEEAPPNSTPYLQYLMDDSIAYKHHTECAIDVHMLHNIIYIIDFNNFLSVYQFDPTDPFDTEYYGFNKQVKFKLLWQSHFEGKLIKSKLINQELYFTTKFEGQITHQVYRHFQLLQFQQLHSDKILQFYTAKDHLLVTSNTYDVQYISVISPFKETDLPLLSAIRLFHKGQYVLNIPFQSTWNSDFDIINIVSILIDENQSQVKLTIINYQMSTMAGFGQSSVLYQDEITKIYDSSYRNNWGELVKYARKDDQLYLIIGTNHYYVRPYRFSFDRYEVTKIKCLSKDINSRHRVVKLKLSHSNLVIQLYNYNNDQNVFYYLNLSTIQHNLDQQQIKFLALEDPRQTIHINYIYDFQILEQAQATEVVFLLQSGDVLVGQIQHPLHVQLMEYAFGTDEDDFGSIRTSKIWIGITIALIVVKLYPSISALI